MYAHNYILLGYTGVLSYPAYNRPSKSHRAMSPDRQKTGNYFCS